MVIARAFNAGIELVHVTATVALLPPPVDLVPLSVLMPDLSKQVRARLTEECQARAGCRNTL